MPTENFSYLLNSISKGLLLSVSIVAFAISTASARMSSSGENGNINVSTQQATTGSQKFAFHSKKHRDEIKKAKKKARKKPRKKVKSERKEAPWEFGGKGGGSF